jgi:hypothetical protein
MLKLVVVGTIAAFVAARHPVSMEMVSHIQKSTTLWTPVAYEENPFVNFSEEQLRGLLGTELEASDPAANALPFNGPDSFDSRN